MAWRERKSFASSAIYCVRLFLGCDDLERFYLFTARFARLLMCELFLYMCEPEHQAIPSWLEHFDGERLSHTAASL